MGPLTYQLIKGPFPSDFKTFFLLIPPNITKQEINHLVVTSGRYFTNIKF